MVSLFLNLYYGFLLNYSQRLVLVTIVMVARLLSLYRLMVIILQSLTHPRKDGQRSLYRLVVGVVHIN